MTTNRNIDRQVFGMNPDGSSVKPVKPVERDATGNAVAGCAVVSILGCLTMGVVAALLALAVLIKGLWWLVRL